MKKRISISLFVVIMALIATVGLSSCNFLKDALTEPNPIDIDAFIYEAEQRDFTVNQTASYTEAIINEYSWVRVWQFDSVADAQYKFDSVDWGLEREFTSRSASTEVNFRHQSRRFTSGATHIVLYRVQDVVLYARVRTADRAQLDNFLDVVITRD